MNKEKFIYFIDKYKIALLFIMFVFLHFYKLVEIPSGIYVDEVSIFLNAENIVEHGTDRYGHSFPLYFQNVKSGQSTLPTYIVALFFKLFGESMFVLRSVFAVSGCIFFIFIYLIAKELFDKKGVFFACCAITIMPYFIMVFRYALDCNMQILFITISLYFYIRAIKYRKIKYFISSGIFFGLTLYTYALSWILIPLFLIISLTILLINKKINIKEIIIFFLPIFIIGWPLIYYVGMLYLDLPEINIGIFTLSKWDTSGLSSMLQSNPINNLTLGLTSTLLHTDEMNYMAFPLFYTMYIPSIILLLNEIFSANKKDLIDKIALGFLFSYLILMTIVDNPNTYKLNSIFIVYLYFIVKAVMKISNKKLKNIIYSLYLAFFVTFSVFYFNTENKEVILFDNGIIEAMEYAKEYEDGKNIYIDCRSISFIRLYLAYVIDLEQDEIFQFETTFGMEDYGKYYAIKDKSIYENSIYIIGNYDNLVYHFAEEKDIQLLNDLLEKLKNLNYEIKKINNYYVIVT